MSPVAKSNSLQRSRTRATARRILRGRCLAVLLLAAGTVGCSSRDRTSREWSGEPPPGPGVRYHGIRADDPEGPHGLVNPERGFRGEAYMTTPAGRLTRAERGMPEGTAELVDGPAVHRDADSTAGGGLPLAAGGIGVTIEPQWLMDGRGPFVGGGPLTIAALPDVEEPPPPGSFGRDLDKCRSLGLSVVQAYCYLDRFSNAPLSREFLAGLDAQFAMVRRAGMKVLLRFAYESETNRRGGPRLDQILRHIQQLEPVLMRNADVIWAVQEGFIGAWGEGHNATHIADNDPRAHTAVLRALLRVLPADRMVMVRVPRYKEMFLRGVGQRREVDEDRAFGNHPSARVGYHNDGFMAGPTDGGTFTVASDRDAGFERMTDESPFVPVDGELFWSDRGWPDRGPGRNRVDGWAAAQRMREHHYATFSLAHSYSKFESRAYSIDRWHRAALTREQVARARMPLSDGYFETSDGRPAKRTQFEYIRDHLGYRLELQRAWFPEQAAPGETVRVHFEVINRGFSVLHNPRPLLIALIAATGQVHAFPVEEVDVRDWQPHEPGDDDFEPIVHRVSADVPLPAELASGDYRLGIWLPDGRASLRPDARYAVRVANGDVTWWTDGGRYGINVLGGLRVRPSAMTPAAGRDADGDNAD